MRKKFLLPVLLAVIALALSGCFLTDKLKDKVSQEVGEKITEKAIESATGADIDLETNSATISTNEGSLSFGEQDLPENFPSDVPVYEPSSIVFSTTTSEGSYSVSLEINADYDSVVEYYTAQAKNNNWTEDYTSNYNSEGSRMAIMNYSKDSGRYLDVSVTETEANKINVGLIVGRQSE
jgi:hypothetical protein